MKNEECIFHNMFWYFVDLKQKYPPETQNNYVVFLKLFVVTETGKELNNPKVGKDF